MKKLWSIFTDNMNRCIYSGYEDPEGTPYPQIERHHIFGGAYRKKSEKYGFVAPLHNSYHPNGVNAPEDWKAIDDDLKSRCREYWEENIGTLDEFREEFGGSNLRWK